MSATPIADMVRQMLDAGSLPTMIVLAVATAENVSHGMSAELSADTEDKYQGRKRKDRERKAAKRAQLTKQGGGKQTMSVSVMSADIPQKSADNRCNLSFFKEENTTEEEVRKKNPVSVVETKKRATRLNPESPLSPADLKFAIDIGLIPERAQRVWAEFVDYWIAVPGQRGTKLDWSATWRNWVRRSAPKAGKQEFKWRSGIEGVV
jgi:hypothetical protein